jgi:F-type H+-transporting ATPase subunit b
MTAQPQAANDFLVPNGTFFFELILFVVVLYLIGKYVVPRLNALVEQRQETIRKQFEDAESAKKRLEAAEKEYTEALAETRRDASRLREQAQAERAQIVDEARTEAQRRVDEMLESAQERISTERQQAIMSLRTEIGELAMTLSERIVHDSLRRDARQRKLVEDFIAGVGATQAAESDEGDLTPAGSGDSA